MSLISNVVTDDPVSSLLTTHVSLETPGCIISAVVTDDPVTKHQAISIHGVDLE